MPAVTRDRGDLLQGTLGLLILKALVAEERHGYGIARWIEETTEDVLMVPEGSLYPALRRLEAKGWIRSRWDVSENNRRARFYALTAAGRRHLEADAPKWMRFSDAVARVLKSDPGVV
jgi:transcriptional regulator